MESQSDSRRSATEREKTSRLPPDETVTRDPEVRLVDGPETPRRGAADADEAALEEWQREPTMRIRKEARRPARYSMMGLAIALVLGLTLLLIALAWW